MKNHLGHTVALLALVSATLLLLLSAVSEEFSLGGLAFRKMDILQDVRPAAEKIGPEKTPGFFTDPNLPAADTILPAENPGGLYGPNFPATADTSLFGKTIEDFSPEQIGLSRFFRAVDSIKTHQNSVRVAFFGDSFVEGDILLGDLRDTLQSIWGGHGVGFVPITSEVAQYRRSFKQVFKGWTTFGVVKNHEAKKPFGINGFVYEPAAEASFRFDGLNYFKNTSRFVRFRFFYSVEKPLRFVHQNLDETPVEAVLPASPGGKISEWKIEKNAPGINAFACRFPENQGLVLYGASLDEPSGFFIDNFSMRGLTGNRLQNIAPETARRFEALLGYDLVVVQLGLNAATASLRNIPWYEKELDETFAHLKTCFPGKPILIVSIADRAQKSDGILTTLPSVLAIAELQRRLARKHGMLFWDMFHAMGGIGTMVRFADHRPALANRDYTHLTHEGGKHMGLLFARLLLSEKARLREL